MLDIGTLSIWLVVAASLAGVAVLLLYDRKDTVRERLLGLPGSRAGRIAGADPAITATLAPRQTVVAAPLPTAIDIAAARKGKNEEKDDDLNARLIQAGFYNAAAVHVYQVVRIGLAITPIVVALVLVKVGLVSSTWGVILGVFAAAAGTIAPSFWLEHRKNVRKIKMRRALPDAMDVMLICLEGGLSLPASIARVARELVGTHPMLATELQIVERQIQMGRTAGEALRELGRRFGMEELRSMSAVVIQAERLGSSVASAMEVFADSLRQRRQQQAEERAQKAAVKMIFPMAFCIFPAMLIVVVGPGVIIVYEQLIKTVMER